MLKKKILYAFVILATAFSAPVASTAQTPMMGWASWNANGVNISASLIEQTADYMVSLGLKYAGYRFVNIDDGYFGGRDSIGNLLVRTAAFPDGMKVVADYIHSKGLKAGIYSDMGANTCGFLWSGYGDMGKGVGLYGHEKQDLDLFFKTWGYDYIKVDYCGAQQQGLDAKTTYTNVAKLIGDIETSEGRDITYNVCRWAFPGTWVTTVADSWRMHGDISNSFSSIAAIIEDNLYLAPYASRGHFNDMDMLQLGRGMTADEERSHFGVWAIMDSPLMIGCNLKGMSTSSLAIMKNNEVIAVNQDTLCLQAELIARTDNCLVLAKPIEKAHGNIRAVALLNKNSAARKIRVYFSDLWLDGSAKVRDLWNHRDLGSFTDYYEAMVPAHGTAMLRIEGERAVDKTRYQGEYAFMNTYSAIAGGGTHPSVCTGTASGGYMMTKLGGAAGRWAEWRDVYSSKGGNYTMRVYYYCADNRYVKVLVNGKSYLLSKLNSGATDKRATVDLSIILNAGTNVIRMTNETAQAPDIDKFELIPEGGTPSEDRFDITPLPDTGDQQPTASSADASNEHWYFIQFRDGGGVIQDMGSGQNVLTKELSVTTTAQMWKVVTDSAATDVYKYYVVGKSGRGLTRVDTSVTSDGFYQTTSDTSEWNLFRFVTSTNTNFGKALEAERSGAGTRHLNQYGAAGYDKRISEWSANDHGNVLQFVPVEQVTGVGTVSAAKEVSGDEMVNVYTLGGRKVRSHVKAAASTQGLAKGVYVAGHRKVLVAK
jgi:hypothetical protein